MSNLLRTLTVAGALAAPLAATAASAPSKVAIPTVSDVLTASGITESGYVDVGFNWNNRQYNAGAFTYGGANDQSFTLNQVGVMFSSAPSAGFGGVVDILGGRDATALPSDGGGIIFKQAYAQYASGAMTLMGGRFVTLAGSEVIASTGNSNATRSLLFGYQPTTHTGVRGAFKLSDAFTLTAGLNNSATGLVSDGNLQKTAELSAAITAGAVTAALTAYKGTESPSGAAVQSPLLVDFVGGFSAGKLSFGLNFDHIDYDLPTNQKTDGLAAYANLAASDTVRIGARAESIKTKDDTGLNHKQAEATVTLAVAAAPNFDLVTDLRYDKDNALIFTGEETMITGVVKGIYKF